MESTEAAGLGEVALGYTVPGNVVEVLPSCCIEGWTRLVARKRRGASHMMGAVSKYLGTLGAAATLSNAGSTSKRR